MKPRENHHEKPIQNELSNKLIRRAIDQAAIGFIVFLWGALLILKQAGMINKNISTWPFPLTAFGILLVVGGLYKLNRPHTDTS